MHAVMHGCLLQTLLIEEGATHLQNGKKLRKKHKSGYQVLL